MLISKCLKISRGPLRAARVTPFEVDVTPIPEIMSVAGRNGPLSPSSLGGGEWPSNKYASEDSLPTGRGNLASPPLSSGSNPNPVMSMNGFPSGPRSNGGGPSPPASVGRSSTYARSDSARNSTRADQIDDSVLQNHYHALKLFLHGRDPNGKNPPNKARDKLLRLSSVQFYELSTDVYDELIRRQSAARAPPNAPNAPPSFLLPEKTFHPKRNQARQRLSSLGPPRFRDLATDVFHELERRFPRFVGAEIPRGVSSISMRGPPGRTGTPSSGYGPGPGPGPGQGPGQGPRGPRMRQPSDAGSLRGPPPSDNYGVPPSPGPNGPQGFGHPMQKQLNQNNTIVPNKSTMVEDDDDDDGDSYALGSNRESKRSAGGSETDKKLIDEYQSQVKELRDKLEGMEGAMKQKEDELRTALDQQVSNEQKKEWDDARAALESQVTDAQALNDEMRQELERMRLDHDEEMRQEIGRLRQDHDEEMRQEIGRLRQDHDEESRQLRQAHDEEMKQEIGRLHQDHDEETRQLRDQLAELQQRGDVGNADMELQEENRTLRESLLEQRQVTDEVRREAQAFMQEMRTLSQQSMSTYEKQLELEQTVAQLETEVVQWKGQYTRTKTQLRSMRAPSIGLTVDQEAGHMVNHGVFTQENGLIKDIHVTKFQIAVDELLQKARLDRPELVIDAMKSVVVNVRRITKDVDEGTPTDEAFAQQKPKLKAKVSAAANHVITSSKNHAAGAGLSPVSLLDAAASHLTAAVVELLRAAKIRPTPAEELEEEDDGSITPVELSGFLSPGSTSHMPNTQETLPPPPAFNGLGGMRASAGSSAYSPISSPRESVEPHASRGHSGSGYGAMNQGDTNGYSLPQDGRGEDLKINDHYAY
ncbi:uncharacterized protein J7T54_000591 [Emericellopsis cladophorae]|uniref:GIT Spa2 homology (SHD) domain-containing protein n=1 Tax=Emericellopsis cladophorae TaxID=2686198 RepID=A0A9P9Y538_9HYPO|nr:uncharacterized protein J7T54_000591 [Emericellopsis cladophorae]KAI6783089.1 hypothetical protein J7T54_000591 [Emericellopsis cladophorae]